MTEQAESQYQSYLLRLWRAGEGKACRVMLERVDSHERHGFADVEELCDFLRGQADDLGGEQEITR
ncbi:MAG: hypothetical protein JW918_07390 [Anaerolineae bacterium]|nr:hypothetical protein [Anaerolineae bacterium]